MMNIIFGDDEQLFQKMQDEWNTTADAFFKTHFELAALTSFDALSWRKFLTHPAVTDWLNAEMRLIQQAKLRSLMKDLDSNTKSTGLPQLMNSLYGQVDKMEKKNDGPIFVYTYIPLNSQEVNANNVQIADNNAIKDITSI